MKKPHIKVLRDAAKELSLKFEKFDPEEVIHFVSQGNKQVWLDRSATEKTSRLSYIIADNKRLTVAALRKFNIPTPKQKMVYYKKDLLEFFRKYKPVVVKPNKCSLGKGVTVGITTQKALFRAFDEAKKYDKRVLIENFVPGNDYRFTVIDYKKVYVLQRIPAFVDGDGRHTVEQLVVIKNKISKKYKKDIKIDDKSKKILKQQGFTLQSVIPENKRVFLRLAANIAEGGTSVDVTSQASVKLKEMAIDACRALKLPSAGIDILTPDISGDKGVVLEVNPRPHIILHHYPHVGRAYSPAKDILKMFFK